MPGYGGEFKCNCCGRIGRRGIDCSIDRYWPDGTVDWKNRCNTCHALRQQQHRVDRDDPDVAIAEETILFVKDPSGNFRGNTMPLVTFIKTLHLGYWDPGLVIRKRGRLYEVVGPMMEPQSLRYQGR